MDEIEFSEENLEKTFQNLQNNNEILILKSAIHLRNFLKKGIFKNLKIRRSTNSTDNQLWICTCINQYTFKKYKI